LLLETYSNLGAAGKDLYEKGHDLGDMAEHGDLRRTWIRVGRLGRNHRSVAVVQVGCGKKALVRFMHLLLVCNVCAPDIPAIIFRYTYLPIDTQALICQTF